MDKGMLSLCGEESFGTGSDHIRLVVDQQPYVFMWLNLLMVFNQVKLKPAYTDGEFS